MSCAVAVLLCAVLGADDAPEDVDLCVGVWCPLGKTCEVVSANATSCVQISLGSGELCLSSEGSLGACGAGMVCKTGGGVGYCAAAEDSSSGTSLVWLWVLLPVMAVAIAGALFYVVRSRRAGDLGYGEFLEQYEQLEMKRCTVNDAENPSPSSDVQSTPAPSPGTTGSRL
eukprot:TRINITY_DN579_c0_g2_i3.p1 TRINITY_DN579_c0_g2~~TRINITY_DN579_c0_g2_i3.p1  ORF type:complete len:186 (+),score=35.95 TRINITY_DN579_c0_g2_i3:48-560(+)